jgi:hypothetical protein
MKSKLHTVALPIQKAFILICEKCGKKLDETANEKDGENPSKLLQKFFKEKIKSDLGKDQARAILGSCQNICPNGQIAISVLPVNGEPARAFIVDAPEPTPDDHEIAQLWNEFKKIL